jgi:hypothetical protein
MRELHDWGQTVCFNSVHNRDGKTGHRLVYGSVMAGERNIAKR